MVLNEIERENAEERIREVGPAAELVRTHALDRFDTYVEAFRSHAKIAEIFVLNDALDRREKLTNSIDGIPVVEAFLAVLGIQTRLE